MCFSVCERHNNNVGGRKRRGRELECENVVIQGLYISFLYLLFFVVLLLLLLLWGFFVFFFVFFLIPVKIIRSGKVKMQGSFIRARVVLTFVYAGFHRSPRMRAIFLREVTLQDK